MPVMHSSHIKPRGAFTIASGSTDSREEKGCESHYNQREAPSKRHRLWKKRHVNFSSDFFHWLC
jgi:hypothetical protein